MIATWFSGQSLSSLWSLINAIQIIHYSAIMTLFLPKIIYTVYSFLAIVNMDFEILATIYQLHFDTSVFDDRTSWDHRFENQGVESTNVLMNCY